MLTSVCTSHAVVTTAMLTGGMVASVVVTGAVNVTPIGLAT